MFGIALSVFIIGCAGTRPTSIGVYSGSLTPCPEKPNCVSSHAKDKKHFSESFPYTTEKSVAFNCLKEIISGQTRTTIVSETDNYLHVEYKTAFFGFVDDAEFYFPENESVVHIRSASRLGYSDLGVNRKRMEGLRALFIEKLKDKINNNDDV